MQLHTSLKAYVSSSVLSFLRILGQGTRTAEAASQNVTMTSPAEFPWHGLACAACLSALSGACPAFLICASTPASPV